MKDATVTPGQSSPWALGISMIHADRASISAAPVDGAGDMVTVTVTTDGDKLQIAVGPGIHVTTVARDENTDEGFTVLSRSDSPYGVDDRCDVCGEHIANPHAPTCVWADLDVAS